MSKPDLQIVQLVGGPKDGERVCIESGTPFVELLSKSASECFAAYGKDYTGPVQEPKVRIARYRISGEYRAEFEGYR